MKCFVNKDLFIYLFIYPKLSNTFKYQIFYVINLPFFIGCRWPSVTARSDVVKWTGLAKCPIELIMGKGAGDCGYTPSSLSVCTWALHTVITNAILIESHLLHSLKKMVMSDGHNWILSIRTVFLSPVKSIAIHWSWKLNTIMYCHIQWPKEANIFYLLPMASDKGSTVTF
jgi:hypothetical protein